MSANNSGRGLSAGIWITSIVAILALAFSGLVATGLLKLPSSTPQYEIELQAAGQPGDGAFTPSFAAAPDAALVSAVDAPGTTIAADAASTATTDAAAAGAYASPQGKSVCDVATFLSGITGDEAKAAAWAQAFAGQAALWDNSALTADGIPEFVGWLTPVLLTADTRLTSHTFADGAAKPAQVVRQKGSAVLVDFNGVPRVDCANGAPLLAPVGPTSSTNGIAYTGDAWAGIEPATFSTVSASAKPVLVFALADPSGALYQRPSRTAGLFDSTEYGTEPILQDATVQLDFDGKAKAIVPDLGHDAKYDVADATTPYPGSISVVYETVTSAFPNALTDGISLRDYNFGGATIDAIGRLKGLPSKGGTCTNQPLGDFTLGTFVGYATVTVPCTDGKGWMAADTNVAIALSGNDLELNGNLFTPVEGGSLLPLAAAISALLTYQRA